MFKIRAKRKEDRTWYIVTGKNRSKKHLVFESNKKFKSWLGNSINAEGFKSLWNKTTIGEYSKICAYQESNGVSKSHTTT